MLRACPPLHAASVSFALCLALATACHSSGDDDHAGNGGAPASGGTGGSSVGGASATGGSSTTAGSGGTNATGGSATGGSSPTGGTAGAATGGANATGGSTSGGSGGNGGSNATGGSGGSATGGAGTAGSATGGSAGTSSPGGASGASGSAGTGANPCDTALFCDDFESYTSAPNGKWSLRTTSGSAIAIDTTEHVSGTKSVKFTTPSASSVTAFMRIQDASIFPVPNNVLYGRMMFRVESEPTQSVHWTMVAGLGLVPGQSYHSEYRYGGQMPITNGNTFVGSQLMANYETPDWYSDKSTPGSDCWHHSNQRIIPAATWTCVEWKFDGANNGMQLWLDGTAADDLTIMGHGDGCVNAAADFTWTAPAFASIDLGWESYQQDDPRTAYVDDVVLSTTKIGCP
jgi:hypothetical protein